MERSVDEDFRYFEAHRDPRTQKLGKERYRIAFVIGDIIGKDRSFQSITRVHGSNRFISELRGERIYRDARATSRLL